MQIICQSTFYGKIKYQHLHSAPPLLLDAWHMLFQLKDKIDADVDDTIAELQWRI